MIVRNGFALSKSSDAGRIEITRMEDSTEAGAEFEAIFSSAEDKQVSYYVSTSGGPTGADRLNADINGKVSFKLTERGSLDVVAGAKRQPQVLNAWQFSLGALLNAGIDIL